MTIFALSKKLSKQDEPPFGSHQSAKLALLPPSAHGRNDAAPMKNKMITSGSQYNLPYRCLGPRQEARPSREPVAPAKIRAISPTATVLQLA